MRLVKAAVTQERRTSLVAESCYRRYYLRLSVPSRGSRTVLTQIIGTMAEMPGHFTRLKLCSECDRYLRRILISISNGTAAFFKFVMSAVE